MKNILLISCVLLFACTKVDNQPNGQQKEEYAFEQLDVTVAQNKAAVVKFYDDTLAVLTRTSSIMVPKYSTITVDEIDNSNNNLEDKYELWQTVAFEDSRKGDYDYNDLVLHIKIDQKKNNTLISIHPIALGSTKNIAFGATIDGRDYIFSENCRKDYFDNEEGFVNAHKDGKRIKYDKFAKKNIPTTQSTIGKSIDWFIVVDNGVKLYAVSKNYPTANRAYGLIFVDINGFGYAYDGWKCGADWFDYPSEGVAIETVYPDFFDADKTFKEIYSNKQSGYYNAIVANGLNATSECLYAIDYSKL